MRAEVKQANPVTEKFATDKPKPVETEKPKDVDLLTLEDIREQIRYIEKAVATKELHYMTRVLRSIVPIRRKLNGNVLRCLVQCYFTFQSQQWNYFMEFLPEAMDAPPKFGLKSRSPKAPPLQPEVEVYLHLLLLIHLLDGEKNKEVSIYISLSYPL